MPRYFFHVDNGVFSADPDGTELADLAAAQAAAVTLSGEIVREKGLAFWASGSPWRLHFTDQAHQLLFTLQFSANVPSAPVLFRPVNP